MVSSLSHNIKSQTHSRVSECDDCPVQVESSAVNRMVTASTGVQTNLPKVVQSSCRPICHSSEPQASAIRVSSPGPKGLGHRCSEHKLDGPHCLCLPSNGSPSQGDPKNQAMPLPDHCNSPRLVRDALVLGPNAALNRDPSATSGVNNSAQTVSQLCVPQQSTSQPPRLVSRSGQLQEQGFSVEVAERIAAPQRSSTRTIYKSKWALFEKWYRENSVDFSTPSVKHISDFFMYLYQDLNSRPFNIDGYRTAIVDTLGPAGHHIALSSDPCEIHAWVSNKVSNLGQWEKYHITVLVVSFGCADLVCCLDIKGFQKDVNYQDPIIRQNFCFDAKDWIAEVVTACESALKLSKRNSFDEISSKLKDEANGWFQNSFTYDEKYKVVEVHI